MTDESDDPPGTPPGAPPGAPRKRYPPPMFAPAAEPAPAAYPPPTVAPAAEPAAAVASGELASGPAPAAAAPAEEPLLPATYRENDLRTAIGSPPMPEQIRPRRRRARERDEEDDGDEDAPRSRRTALAVIGILLVGLGIAALVVLGRLNSARYVMSCDAKEVVAEQGRAFPPWGTSRLGGDEWKPIPIPASSQCVGLETEDPTELGDAFRKVLLERAEALLTAKEVTQIEPAAELLDQALLHARSDSDAHKNARQAIQRMIGDVGYWRASAKLQKAATDLADAAKQFETAAGQRPRYVSDANAWATYVRKLVGDLRAGPAGARAQAGPADAAAPSAPDRPAAPTGVALPVEPAAGGGSGPGSAETPPSAPPDAGILPTGGVLL